MAGAQAWLARAALSDASGKFLPPLRGSGMGWARFPGPCPGLPSAAPPGRTAGKQLVDAPLSSRLGATVELVAPPLLQRPPPAALPRAPRRGRLERAGRRGRSKRRRGA